MLQQLLSKRYAMSLPHQGLVSTHSVPQQFVAYLQERHSSWYSNAPNFSTLILCLHRGLASRTYVRALTPKAGRLVYYSALFKRLSAVSNPQLVTKLPGIRVTRGEQVLQHYVSYQVCRPHRYAFHRPLSLDHH